MLALTCERADGFNERQAFEAIFMHLIEILR
jgi:hypothetical protein